MIEEYVMTKLINRLWLKVNSANIAAIFLPFRNESFVRIVEVKAKLRSLGNFLSVGIVMPMLWPRNIGKFFVSQCLPVTFKRAKLPLMPMMRKLFSTLGAIPQVRVFLIPGWKSLSTYTYFPFRFFTAFFSEPRRLGQPSRRKSLSVPIRGKGANRDAHYFRYLFEWPFVVVEKFHVLGMVNHRASLAYTI